MSTPDQFPRCVHEPQAVPSHGAFLGQYFIMLRCMLCQMPECCLQEHQDAHEFLYQLHDIMDGGGAAGRPETKPMFAAMGGTSVQSIRCQTVDYESRKVEEFTHISVDVQVCSLPASAPCVTVCVASQQAQQEPDHARSFTELCSSRCHTQ